MAEPGGASGALFSTRRDAYPHASRLCFGSWLYPCSKMFSPEPRRIVFVASPEINYYYRRFVGAARRFHADKYTLKIIPSESKTLAMRSGRADLSIRQPLRPLVTRREAAGVLPTRRAPRRSAAPSPPALGGARHSDTMA